MLPIEIIIILIILMFLASFLYSNLGLGGGTLYVPILVFIAVSMNRQEIIAVSLFLSFMTQLPAAITHFRNGLVRVRIGLLLAIATIPGVIIGIVIGLRSTDVMAYCLFSLLLFLTAIKMFYDIYKKRFDKVTKDRKHSSLQLAIVFMISIFTGIVSAFFGVGGGIVTVPVLIYILGVYPRRAIGTSALMIVVTSIMGFALYALISFNVLQLPCCNLVSAAELNIPFDLALVLGIVVLVGAYLGSTWGLKVLRTRSIQLIFALVILIVGVQLLLRALGYL